MDGPLVMWNPSIFLTTGIAIVNHFASWAIFQNFASFWSCLHTKITNRGTTIYFDNIRKGLFFNNNFSFLVAHFLKSFIITLLTGKALSEALILGLTNPQYDKRLFIDLPVQYMKTTMLEHSMYTVNVLSAKSTDECLRTKSKDN